MLKAISAIFILIAISVFTFTNSTESTTVVTTESPTTTTETMTLEMRDVVQFLQSVTTTTTTTIARVQTPANFAVGDGSRWDQLAQCECGGNWGCNTGNGFGGGLQFMHQSSYSTWLSFGGGEFAPHPWEATREEQIVVAEKVLARSGWKAWPGCSRKFGWL